MRDSKGSFSKLISKYYWVIIKNRKGYFAFAAINGGFIFSFIATEVPTAGTCHAGFMHPTGGGGIFSRIQALLI
ncbi:hypothetical protein D3C85_1459870 [compost metagenome]